jgi:hypothetical protein
LDVQPIAFAEAVERALGRVDLAVVDQGPRQMTSGKQYRSSLLVTLS